MARYSRFNFLCDDHERQIIADLAFLLQRSQSDAVRFVVIETARQLSQSPALTIPPLHIETGQPIPHNKRKKSAKETLSPLTA